MKKALGVCEWCLPVRGPALLKAIKSCGLDAFQVDTGLFEEGVPLSFPEVQDAYLAAAGDAQVELRCAGNNALCTYGMVHPESSEKHSAAKEIIRKSIEAAGAMNIPILMLPSMFDGFISDEDGFRNTAEMLKWACRYAMDKGVVISWENVLGAEENLRMLEAVGQTNFGIGFDTQNPHGLAGHYVPDMIRKLSGHINLLHIKDGTGANLGVEHYGDGDSGFLESAKAIKESGFDGCIISENMYKKMPFIEKDGDPFKAIREDVKRFSSIFS